MLALMAVVVALALPPDQASAALERFAAASFWSEAADAARARPSDWIACRRLVDAAFAGGRVREAEALLESLARDHPAAEPLTALGLLAARERRWADAVARHRDALARDPTSFRTIRLLLESARAAGVLDRERARLRRVLVDARLSAHRLYANGYGAALAYDWAAAEPLLRESLAAAPSAEAAAALATGLHDLGSWHPCFDVAEAALARPSAAAEPFLRVELVVLLGACRNAFTNELDVNRRDLAEALRVATDAGDLAARARALRQVGLTRHYDAKSLEGLPLLEEAIAIDERLGEDRALAFDLFYASYAWPAAHPFEERLPLLPRTLTLAEGIRDRQFIARVHGNLGASLKELGRHAESLRELLAAEAGLAAVGPRRSRAANAGNLTELCLEIGDDDCVRRYGGLSVSLYAQMKNVQGEAMTTATLGDLARRRGDLAASLVHHRRAVELIRPRAETMTIRPLLVALGRDYLALGDHRSAAAAFDESLALSLAAGEASFIAAAHTALGDLYRATARDADAAAAYERALQLATGDTEATMVVAAHHGLALLRSRAGDIDGALVHFRAAIDRIERVRTATERADLQMLYFADRRAVYLDAIASLVDAHGEPPDRHHHREAFELAERARARTLVDAVAARDRAIPAATLDHLAASLGPGDLLLEFIAGAEQSFVFTLDADGRLDVERSADRRVVERAVRALRQRLSVRPSAADAAPQEAALHRDGAALLARLAPSAVARIHAATRLLIVADGALLYLPFEALSLPGARRYLGEDREIVTAPAASLLFDAAEPAAQAPASDLVAFGDPIGARTTSDALRQLAASGFSFGRLPGTRREVADVGALFDPDRVRVYTGAAFTKAAVIEELQRPHRFVHFATHALVDERQPRRSAIVVSPRPSDPADAGLIAMGELAELSIRAELVTLSACQTGLGRAIDGEGLVGLAWAFRRAGARSLVVTLWSVSDASTAAFMVAFYRALRTGAPASRALLDGRRALLQGANPALRHPYYWAGYTLIGGATRR